MSAFIRSDASRKAEIVYVVGATGAGKSSRIKKDIEHDKRVIVFDPDDEYGNLKGVHTCFNEKQVLELIKAHKTTPLRVRLVKEGADAAAFCCDCAFTWTNCTLVAEEIADWTNPGKAPLEWGRVIRRGARKRAIRIFGVSQRPAEADKTILSQASLIVCGIMGTVDDRKSMAKTMDIPERYLTGLGPLDFIEYHKNAQRSIFVGNYKDGTRLDATAKMRDSIPLTDAGGNTVQKPLPAAKKQPARARKQPQRG